MHAQHVHLALQRSHDLHNDAALDGVLAIHTPDLCRSLLKLQLGNFVVNVLQIWLALSRTSFS